MIDPITLIIILIVVAIAFFIGQKLGSDKKHREWEEALPDHRKDAIMKSRAVLGGQFSEQLAPFLPNFKYLPTECRFVGKAKLSEHEKNLKETIDAKRVRWEEYRIPEELTKKKVDYVCYCPKFDQLKEVR